jgi:hypothetical protein
MKKRFIVCATMPCRTCEGDCYVTHPTWKAYGAQVGTYTVPEFFLNRGYLPGEALPPVRALCPTCQGFGELPAAPAAPATGWLAVLGRLLYKIMGGVPL